MAMIEDQTVRLVMHTVMICLKKPEALLAKCLEMEEGQLTPRNLQTEKEQYLRLLTIDEI